MKGLRLLPSTLALLAAAGVASEGTALRARSKPTDIIPNDATEKMWTAVEPCMENRRPRLDCQEKWHDEELCNGTDPHLPRCNLISKCTWHCPQPTRGRTGKFACKKPVNKLQRMGHAAACAEMGQYSAPYYCRRKGEVCCTPTNADVSGRGEMWGGCIRDDGEDDMTTRRKEVLSEA